MSHRRLGTEILCRYYRDEFIVALATDADHLLAPIFERGGIVVVVTDGVAIAPNPAVQIIDGVDDLPPGLAGFAALLEAQPAPAREAFHYCLCLMMVETGAMHLIEQIPGESGALCRFETASGEQFAIPRSPLSEAQEAEILALLREILDDEGLL